MVDFSINMKLLFFEFSMFIMLFLICSISSKFVKIDDGTGKRVSFESFPRAVQQLTLNAIPSSEATIDILEEDTTNNVSIFYSKLQHWDELNMSQGFTELKRAVKKFTNLPMVIFNQNQVTID